MEEAKDTDRKLIAFTVVSCVAVGAVLAVFAPLFPQMYNTTDSVRALATWFIRIVAVYIPVCAFLNACYFTLRAGGRTIITFLFDSVFIWCVSVVLAFALAKFTSLPILWIYFFVQLADGIKAVIGLVLVKKGVWLHNIVE